MIAARIHPEHLIDRVVQGRATETQREELRAHVATCRECSAELEFAQAFSARGEKLAHDDSRSIACVLDTLEAEGRLAPADKKLSSTSFGRSAGWLPWVAALTLFFAGSAAAATLILVLRPAAPIAPQVVAPRAAPVPQAPAQHEQDTGEQVPAEQPALELEPPAAPEAPPGRAQPRVRRAPSSSARVKTQDQAPAVAPEPEVRVDAVSLFARARAASLRGEYREAEQTYHELEARFPSSREALVAPVMLGRIYADHFHDPAGALAQFDRYLRRPGVNRPEALMGRARALRALGREAEERVTLQALIAGYPDSVYVAAARHRIEALE